MSEQLYYFQPQDRVLSSTGVKNTTGLDTESASVETLNRSGLYPITKVDDPYNSSLYTTVLTYTVSGQYAVETWTPTARPLATAKTNGKQDVRTRASENSAALRESSGYSADALSAAAAQLEADRGADVQATIALTDSVMAQADSNIQAVDAATSVSDIADVVDAPDLVINTGRGTSGDSLDINPTYFPTINLGNVVESDLELYIPATDRTLGYRTNLPAPYRFDSNTAAFTAGDSRIVVRIAATGVVLGTAVCPDTGAGANVDVNIYTAQS